MYDLEVSKRQQIGHWWRPHFSDERTVRELLEGTLTLTPHPPWQIPNSSIWNEDPFGQQNWRFQLHCLKWLDPLRRVAIGGGEYAASARTMWLSTVRSWASEHMYSDDEFAWMDMADGLRSIELVLGAQLVPENERANHAALIRLHADKLADPSRRGIGNHALHQLQGLYVSACFLQDSQLRNEARAQIGRLFEENYDAEGINAEGSLSYHDLNFHWWKTALARLSAEGDSLDVAESILGEARRAICHFVRPDGTLEMIGDTPEGRGISDDGTPDTLFVRTKGREGVPPSSKAKVFARGYAAGRSDWSTTTRSFESATFYSLRFGRAGAVHGHSDAGSFTIYAHGRPWVVDPGMYAYQRDRYRRYFVSVNAHNVVAPVDGSAPSGQDAELLASTTDDHIDYYCVKFSAHDDFTVTRRFYFVRSLEAFLVFDSLVPLHTRAPAIEFSQLWHFHPDCAVEIHLDGVALSWEGDRARVRWAHRPILEITHGQEEPMQGWYSPSYGEAIPSPVVQARPESLSRTHWLAAVSFGDVDVRPTDFKITDSGLRIEFQDSGQRYQIDHSEVGGPAVWTKL